MRDNITIGLVKPQSSDKVVSSMLAALWAAMRLVGGTGEPSCY